MDGSSGLTQLTGLSQGMFIVTRTPSGDVIASRAMASERMLDGSGHPARSEPVAMPWSELKAKLVEALSGIPRGNGKAMTIPRRRC